MNEDKNASLEEKRTMKEILIHFDEQERKKLTTVRVGETKLGEKVQCFKSAKTWREELNASDTKFVLTGIPEDIGIRANFGREGSSGMWDVFLSRFLNIQSNDFLSGEKILVAGRLNLSDLMEKSEQLDVNNANDIKQLRLLTEEVDERVTEMTKWIVQSGKIPVFIGGGHNNAFGILKGCSVETGKKINCLNIDPHADLRELEGRHSGNGFSYALKENYLGKYYVAGLHENYNSTFILEQFKTNKNLDYFSYDHYLRGDVVMDEILPEIVSFLGKQPCGIEIDLDSIAGFPSSAETPSGFRMDEMRRLIMYFSNQLQLAYLHFAEGSPAVRQNDQGQSGKALAYLVTDALKNFNHILNSGNK